MNIETTIFEFNNAKHQPKVQLSLAFLFIFFTFLALRIDSVLFAKNHFDGRIIINFATIIYFFLMYFSADIQLRKLMFVMVFLSYVGELIFCKLLGMYAYRNDHIPLYVPFGHAIVYASGYIFAHTQWAKQNEKRLRPIFAIFFVLIFLFVGVFFNDIFSLIFGALFFVLMKRKRWDNLYYFIALCVIYIELVGTHFQCWKWHLNTFNFIPTLNPPMGAVFFYIGGDGLLAKIVTFLDKRKLKNSL